MRSENPTREEFINILWEKGIMGRIAPEDDSRKQARQDLRKTVWPGDKNDPILYLHILYSAAAAKEAIQRSWSIITTGKGYADGIFNGSRNMLFSDNGAKVFPELKNSKKNGDVVILDELIARAKKEIENHGGVAPKKILSYDEQGEWQGISVTVDRFGGDGRVYLQLNNGKDMDAFLKANGPQGVMPELINPDNFHKPEE